MALISLRQLLDHAAENDYGVLAFNVKNLEQVRAIMEGAALVNSPVILQASTGAVRRFLPENRSEFDPRKFLIPTIEAMREIVKERLIAFGTADQISKIKKVYSLEEMHHRYAESS